MAELTEKQKLEQEKREALRKHFEEEDFDDQAEYWKRCEEELERESAMLDRESKKSSNGHSVLKAAGTTTLVAGSFATGLLKGLIKGKRKR